MKKLLFTGLLGLGLLLPASFTAAKNETGSKTEFSTKKPSKKSNRKSKSSKAKSLNSYSQSKGCTYNGSKLYVGKRGGCYYYAGNSKQYVDRSYCSSCN